MSSADHKLMAAPALPKPNPGPSTVTDEKMVDMQPSRLPGSTLPTVLDHQMVGVRPSNSRTLSSTYPNRQPVRVFRPVSSTSQSMGMGFVPVTGMVSMPNPNRWVMGVAV